MQDQFRCPFCYEKFDNAAYTPKIMIECGHNICEVCLLNFMDKGKNSNCPIEGKIIEFKKLQIQMFPDNHELLQLINKQNKDNTIDKNRTKRDQKIKLQNSPKNSQSRQTENEQSLLNLPAINQIDLQSHTKTGDSSKSNQKINLYCEEHQKNCELICIDCEQRCCYKCAIFDKHKSHTLKEVEDFTQEISEYQNSIETAYKQLENKEDYFENQIQDFSFNPKIEKKLKFLQKKIVLDFDRAVQTLLNEKKKILQKLQDQKEQRQSQLDTYIKKCMKLFQDESKDLKLKTQTLVSNLSQKDELKKIKLYKNYQQNSYLQNLKNLKSKLKSNQKIVEQSLEQFFDSIEDQYAFEFNPVLKTFDFPEINFKEFESKNFEQKKSLLTKNKSNDQEIKDDELLTDMKLNEKEDPEIEALNESFNHNKSFRSKRFKLHRKNNQSIANFSEIRSQISFTNQKQRQSHNRVNCSFDLSNQNFSKLKNDRKKLEPSIKKMTSFLEYTSQQNQKSSQKNQSKRNSITSNKSFQNIIPLNLKLKNIIDSCKRRGSSILNLSNMKLTDDDVELMQNSIRFNKKLLTLDLSNNMIGYKGIQQLCSYMENSSIVKLNISTNNLSQKALNPLLHLAKQNKTIKEIDFTNNKVSKKNIEKAMNLFSKEYIKIIL